MNRKCPAPGCEERVGPGPSFLCRRHWFTVPKDLRNRIWQLYKSARNSPEHRAAVFQAMRGLK